MILILQIITSTSGEHRDAAIRRAEGRRLGIGGGSFFLRSPQTCAWLHRMYTEGRGLALARDQAKVQSQRTREAFGHESVRGSLSPVRWNGVEECQSERRSSSHAL